MTPPRTPRLQEVIDAALERALGELYVCRPGRVVAYDAAKQAADVQPIHRETYLDEDGIEQTAGLPLIHRVPVLFPSAGGFRITFPLQAGDDVLLVFSDVGLDKYLSNGGQNIDPVALHQHDLTDAVAIPGMHPFNGPWTGAGSPNMTLGADGGVQVVLSKTEVLLGGADANHPAVLGDSLKGALDAFTAALGTFAALCTGPTGPQLGALTTAITNLTAAAYLSTLAKVK